MRHHPISLASLLPLAAFLVACATAAPRPDATQVVDDPLAPGFAPTKGPDDALVTIQEFSSFSCPFCGRAQGTLAEVLEAYGDDVRVVARQMPLPFQPRSEPAARAALAAHLQGAYWAYAERVYGNMRAQEDSDLLAYAEDLGLDLARFEADWTAPEVEDQLAHDRALAEELGVRGTPMFFINGRLLRGAQPYPAFAALIDEEIARARRAVRQGMPRGSVSAWLTVDNLERAAAEAEVEPPHRPAEPRPDTPPQPTFAAVDYGPDHPARGAREDDALVTLVVFTNYQCPFCGRLEPTLDAMLARWPNEVRVVYRHRPLPFHEHAKMAAEAAQEAWSQGLFEPFHRLMMANQRALTRDHLLAYAAEAGLDTFRFSAALDEGRHRARVDEDDTEAQAVGARGTPTSFVNGRILVGAQPPDAFAAAIEAALDQARQVADETGLSGRALYDRILELGEAAEPAG
jgi:protein-disulfide isomerase